MECLYLDYTGGVVEIDVAVRPGFTPEDLEAACSALGLSYNRLTLARYVGCVHWHVSKPGVRGTLEATWWPATKRFWFSIHANRRASWHDGVVEKLEDLISGGG